MAYESPRADIEKAVDGKKNEEIYTQSYWVDEFAEADRDWETDYQV